MANVSTGPNLLRGFNTTLFSKPDVTAVTAWTTGNSPVALWTVTGAVLARVYGVVTATGFTSTGATGTLSIGISGTVQLFLPTTTANGTNLVASSVWLDSAPTVAGKVLSAVPLTWVLLNGANIILTVATNSMTAGGITLFCDWIPVSAGATVV